MTSVYTKDYPSNKGESVEKPHPEDLLKTGGPAQQLTSYNHGFPGFKGDNQYVKPTDKHIRGKLEFKGTTTYSKSFIGDVGAKADKGKVNHNLKTGYQWFGSTTYKHKYLQPNREIYPIQEKKVEKLNAMPGFKRQFGKNDLI